MEIVVLGAGYAGVMAALRLSRSIAGRHRVRLVNAMPDFVERIRLHEVAAGRGPDPIPLSRLITRANVELVVGRVTAVDPLMRRVRIGSAELAWDRLVLALGSQVDVYSVPGAAQHAFTLDGAQIAALAAELARLSKRGGRVAIVGGGLSGIEAAAELAEAFPRLRLTLLTRTQVGAELSPRARRHIGTRLRAAGVELRERAWVQRVEAAALVTEQGELPFDACVWAAGFVAPALVANAGLAVNARGQLLVDGHLRSRSHPEIYAAGDLAALDPAFGAELPMGCKTALPAGAHVARSLVAEIAGQKPPRLSIGTPFYCLSLGRADGVIQVRDSEGALHGPAITGKTAATIKEWICKSTRLALQFEGRRAARYLGAARAVAPAEHV